MSDKDKELLDWYEGLPSDLNAFTRPPGPEGTSNTQMEIEIRPREPEDVIKIEKQAEAQKALAYARSLVPKIEKLASLDGEEAKHCKKEIQHIIDKLMETINGKREADTDSVE